MRPLLEYAKRYKNEIMKGLIVALLSGAGTFYMTVNYLYANVPQYVKATERIETKELPDMRSDVNTLKTDMAVTRQEVQILKELCSSIDNKLDLVLFQQGKSMAHKAK